ncbi:Nodulin MtN3 family protein [Perilla frutescens var. hirtella]|uniref:Bidirectional sugar transporter SWEET n=1 Tax=Perilla frutescens var. hirtella TaxID=608512 RepID=A0AAD4IVF0_PERFH|nr:Nodulin MtN3 family protein [Perilla frutescens var. frutescens]KAH6784038.1 Nodulin MtN3 family protein [Perilla frutescens var. hirtella]KAH6822224.1 Nodulin MtN3 family protein [Perilla frutescens var. hirtella]
MEEKFRITVGILGNAASMLLYAAPVLTFSRMIKKKSTEEYSCVPYIMALLNCFLYTWYGLPVVSYKWENFPVVTINGLGILLELSFILIYFYFASANGKKKVAMMTLPVFLLSCSVALISAFVFHDHHHRKAFVGSIGLVASVAMYGSPLVVMKKVIQTKSVEFMPFYLSLFSFLASSLWMAYGLLSHDLFLASPNLVGSPLGILQLFLYCIYRKRLSTGPPHKWDLESHSEKSDQHLEVKEGNTEKPIQYLKVNDEKDDEKANQQLQVVVTDATNGKN